ncbi:hypothetical protein AB5I41_02495 [Sphingomonas sp. MMS24-JH45]
MAAPSWAAPAVTPSHMEDPRPRPARLAIARWERAAATHRERSAAIARRHAALKTRMSEAESPCSTA